MTVAMVNRSLPFLVMAQASKKPAEAGAITQSIVDSESIPTGYKGADDKVEVDKKGTISFKEDVKGNDVGFFVEFMPVNVGKNKALTVEIKGKIFQRQGWAKYASIQVIDKGGKRFILDPLCQSVWEDCTQDRVIDISEGKALKIKLPAELKDIKRFEVVFIGETKVFKGLTISNIGLSE